MFEILLVLTLLYTSLPERCDAQCPTTLPPTIVKSACSTQTELDAIKSQIATQVASMIDNSLSGCILPIGSSQIKPATTCQQVLLAYPSSTSGYFWVLNATGGAVRIYCRFDSFTNLSYFGLSNTSGYARLTSVNVTADTVKQCPTKLTSITVSGHNLCQKSTGSSCDSVTISTLGLRWQTVCGRITGYQYGTSENAFAGTTTTVDSLYVDGVSITYGSPRNHLWSYGIGKYESNQANGHNCPCSSGPAPPTFVGASQYCESGVPKSNTYNTATYAINDPLWDGMNCGDVEVACCLPTVQPWFCKKLSSPVTGDLEMRLCMNDVLTAENVGLEQWEFYVL